MNQYLLPKILNSVGILCDMVGACFVAWEVVQQYRGRQFDDQPVIMDSFTPSPEKTPEYKKWERNKYAKMKIGLIALSLGFLLQGASNWVYTLKDIMPHATIATSDPISPTQNIGTDITIPPQSQITLDAHIKPTKK